ncbi:MAG: chemotaxis protein CheW, partial [Candidatus Lokiarchaeota archaeon]|nr:chemotaxis protein CheW [Candidatus Lokiarchaeota archaeon]
MLETDSENIEFRDTINVVIIKVLNERYLIEVDHIKEIYVPGENIIPVPLTEKSIVGIINIRGEIYSIISLRHNIFESEVDYGLNNISRILLLEYEDLKIALLVDAVIGVKDIPFSVFKKQGTIVKTNIDFRLIKLTGIFQDETLILLDLEALIKPYLKSLGTKIEKKVEQKPKSLERPKVQPKLRPKSKTKPTVESTVVIPQKFQPSLNLTAIPEDIDQNDIALSDEQQDILKEIGNIGTGNAVTALSRLVKKKIDVTLTDVGIIPLNELPTQFGGPNEKVCGIFCHIEKP